MRLNGKTAIVTGAARGIGRAIAEVFHREGANLVLTDILADEVEAVTKGLGARARFLHQDISDEAGWQAVLTETQYAFSVPDILVNNAGILSFAALEDISVEQMRRVLDVNLLGAIIGTKTIGAAMKAEGRGSIINMSSADGLSGANALSAYVASKWGLRGFTKAAALEFGPHGVRVNSIHPGGVYTPMANAHNVTREQFDQAFKIYPAQRGCDPDEIAEGALYLASDESRYCMGTELAIDGGLSAGHYYFGLPGAPDV